MKAQPWQLDPEQYDFHFPVTPLYGHLDTERHVNNVAVQSFHSEARLRFLMRALGEPRWFSDDVLLRPKRTVTQFIGETHYLSDVTCAARLVALDKDSYRMALALFQNGECVGVQECLMGAWRDDQGWVALPEHVRAALAETLNPADALATWPEMAVEDSDVHDYPCRTDLVARYADLDPDRRLAELSVARYLEQSRAGPLDRIRLPRQGLLVARIDIVYRRWQRGVAALETPSGIGHVGNTSFTVRGAVLADGQPLAVGESVMVLMDRDTHRPTPATDALRRVMAEISV